jgi:RNA polymerase sigma-70 factor (ECF subfamily)
LNAEKHKTCQFKQEKDLITRIANADEVAFEQLYSQYFSRLYRFISRVIGDSDQIEEIINDVMYVVWEKAVTYNHTCRPSTWIFGIAYNKAIGSLKKPRFVAEQSLDVIDKENVFLATEDAGLKQLEMNDWLHTGFETLSPDQRAVVELTYFHGMNYIEIAKLMECPENTIKTRMFHARKKLAPILQRLSGDSHGGK